MTTAINLRIMVVHLFEKSDKKNKKTSTLKILWAAQTKKETAYKLMKLHTSSWNCMQVHETACKLMELHVSSMEAYVTAYKSM